MRADGRRERKQRVRLVQCTGGTGRTARCAVSCGRQTIYLYHQKAGTTVGTIKMLTLGNEAYIRTNGGFCSTTAPWRRCSAGAIGSVASETVFSVATRHSRPRRTARTCWCRRSGAELLPGRREVQRQRAARVQVLRPQRQRYSGRQPGRELPGPETETTGYDVNKLFVYYWCDSAARGLLADECLGETGRIRGQDEQDDHGEHEPLLDVRRAGAVSRNYAPRVFRRVAFDESVPFHTYPNPWRTGDPTLKFNVGGVSCTPNDTLVVTADIVDIRGHQVRTIMNTLVCGAAGSIASPDLAAWDARNNSGAPAASGVYLYRLRACDSATCEERTGKLSILH